MIEVKVTGPGGIDMTIQVEREDQLPPGYVLVPVKAAPANKARAAKNKA